MSKPASRCDDTVEALRDEVQEVAGTCFALNARRSANHLARLYTAHLESTGLEIAQFSTLCIIADGRARTVQAIADYIGADRSTLARNLKLLVRRGLIEEHREGSRLEYQLSHAGVTVTRSAIPYWREAQRLASI